MPRADSPAAARGTVRSAQPRRDTTCLCGAFGADVPCLSPEDDPVKQSETDLTVVTSEAGLVGGPKVLGGGAQGKGSAAVPG
jgi:hypothetical protein